MSDLVDAVKAIRGAHTKLQQALDYYEGNVGEVFASQRLRRKLADDTTSYRINFARTPVSAVLDRLEVTAATGADENMQKLVDRIWEHNDLEQEQHGYHEWALVFGYCNALVWPRIPDDPEAPIEDVDVTYESPFTTRVFYDPEHPRRITHAAKLWETGSGDARRFRCNIYYPDRIEKYVTKGSDQKGDDDRHWARWVDTFRDADPGEPLEVEGRVIVAAGGEEVPVWPVPNPYDTVPIFPFQTRTGYGRPEHKDAYGPQNIVNKITATHPEAIDFYAAPQRVWLAEAATGGADEEDDFDEPLRDDDEREPRLNAQPGGLWRLPGGSVYQFDPASASGFLDPLHAYVESMAAVTDTPVHKFKGMSGAPSGEALRAAEAGLTAKVRRRQASFGATWVRLLQFAVLILQSEDDTGETEVDDGDVDTGAGVLLEGAPLPAVSVSWRPSEAHDDTDRAAYLRGLDQAGAASILTRVRKAQPDLSIDEARQEARRIASQIGVPLETLDPGEEWPTEDVPA